MEVLITFLERFFWILVSGVGIFLSWMAKHIFNRMNTRIGDTERAVQNIERDYVKGADVKLIVRECLEGPQKTWEEQRKSLLSIENKVDALTSNMNSISLAQARFEAVEEYKSKLNASSNSNNS